MKLELKKESGIFNVNILYIKMYIDDVFHESWLLKDKKQATEYFDNYNEGQNINEVIKTRTI